MFVVVWINRDRADGLDRLFVKNRAISRSSIIGFPNAATGGTDKKRDFPRRFLRSRNRGDTSAHRGRTDVARAQTGNGGGTKLSLLRARIRGGKTNRAN